MTTLRISDQSSPDSTKIGAWLFRHRTSLPLPFAFAIVLLRVGEMGFSWPLVGAGVAVFVTPPRLRRRERLVVATTEVAD